MGFGDKVKQVRYELCMTQEDMARKLGVSFATVNRWENNRTEPSHMAVKCFLDFCAQNKIKFEGETEDNS